MWSAGGGALRSAWWFRALMLAGIVVNLGTIFNWSAIPTLLIALAAFGIGVIVFAALPQRRRKT